jgi:hypothetical protein
VGLNAPPKRNNQLGGGGLTVVTLNTIFAGAKTVGTVVSSEKRLAHKQWFVAHICTEGTPHAREFKFPNAALVKYCNDKNIERRYSSPYEPRGNAVTERFNGIVTKGIATALEKGDIRLWDWCGAAVSYVYNRIGGENSPFYRRFGRLPSTRHWRKFGSLCYAHEYVKEKSPRGKYSPNAVRGVYLGCNPVASNFLVGVYRRDNRARTGLKFTTIECRAVVVDESTMVEKVEQCD